MLVNQFPDLEADGPGYQYYAISEWTVEGTCMCNGHASMCVPAPGESISSDKVCM